MQKHTISATETTRQLSTLLEVSRQMTSTLELQPLLGQILDQLKMVIDYTGAAVYRLEGEQLAVLAYRGPASEEEMMRLRFHIRTAPIHADVLLKGTPRVIPDVQEDTKAARAFRGSVGQRMGAALAYVRSWMGVPLVAKGQAIGMLGLYYPIPDAFSRWQAELVLAFANHAAVAIDNSRLYEGERERRLEAEKQRNAAEGLREILAAINASRPLDEVLDKIVTHAADLLATDQVGIQYRASDDAPPAVHAIPNPPKSGLTTVVQPDALKAAVVSGSGAVVLSCDGNESAGCSAAFCSTWGQNCRTVIAVPLTIQGKVRGGLEVCYRQGREISPEEIQLAEAIGDQAALAIENSMLRTQAEHSAIVAERNRIARDLHDAVTQTLFAASLIADVLPRLWPRNPDEGLRRLEELRQLTRGALAEMRTLLLELRPSALTEVSLADLLRQLVEAIVGRSRLPISIEIDGEPNLPEDVQAAMYRISQEALNNVVKHSGATSASVLLRSTQDEIDISIADNGRGFDGVARSAEHLGLKIMRERADSIGAELAVTSASGRGTVVRVKWRRTGGAS